MLFYLWLLYILKYFLLFVFDSDNNIWKIWETILLPIPTVTVSLVAATLIVIQKCTTHQIKAKKILKIVISSILEWYEILALN